MSFFLFFSFVFFFRTAWIKRRKYLPGKWARRVLIRLSNAWVSAFSKVPMHMTHSKYKTFRDHVTRLYGVRYMVLDSIYGTDAPSSVIAFYARALSPSSLPSSFPLSKYKIPVWDNYHVQNVESISYHLFSFTLFVAFVEIKVESLKPFNKAKALFSWFIAYCSN